MKKNKFLVALLGASLLAFVGCSGAPKTEQTTTSGTAQTDTQGNKKDNSNFNETGYPVVNDSVTLKVLIGAVPDAPQDLNNIPIIKEAEETTNVKINWINPGSQGFQEKKNLMLSTGDLPDMIIQGVSGSDMATYGKEGAFIPMKDLITQYAPNLKKLLEEYPETAKVATAPDGNMYGVPRVSEGPWGKNSSGITAINTAWLEKLDLQMPTTLDEYYEVLKAFKTQDPNGNGQQDEIAFITTKGINGYRDVFYAYGIPLNGGHLDVKEDQVVTYVKDEGFKKSIMYLNKLYKDGLIDEESFVINGEQHIARLNMQPISVGVSPIWDIPDVFTTPEALESYDFMPLLRNPEGNEPVAYFNPSYGYCGNGGVITSKCETPEVAMRWIDYWYDYEKSMESIEGKIGDRLLEQPDGSYVLGNAPEGMTMGAHRYNSCLGWTGLWWVTEDTYKTQLRLPTTDAKVAFFDEYYQPYFDKEALPSMILTTEESQRIADVVTNFNSFVERKVTEWIRNGKVEEEWDSYVAELDKMGLPTLLEVRQQAYDRYLEK